MLKVETLTINEALDVFRDYGVSMSYETLVAWIDSGSVKWAVSGRAGGANGLGKPLRKIFKRPLIEWLESMAEDETA